MFRGPITTALVCLALLGGTASAAPDAEASLRAELLAATWPTEVVRLAADYRSRFPRGPSADDAASRATGAARAQRALESKDVNLSRTAFADAAGVSALRADAERALLGEGAAALRLAHAYRDGKAAPPDALRQVEWLQFAAALDEPAANYELSRHYRGQAQMPLAAKYQARAVELGFVLPRELEPERK